MEDVDRKSSLQLAEVDRKVERDYESDVQQKATSRVAGAYGCPAKRCSIPGSRSRLCSSHSNLGAGSAGDNYKRRCCMLKPRLLQDLGDSIEVTPCCNTTMRLARRNCFVCVKREASKLIDVDEHIRSVRAQ